MHVLVCSGGYPSQKYILNGIFEFDQAKALTKAGCDVTFVALDIRSIRRWRKWGVQKILENGMDVYIINIPCGPLGGTIKSWMLRLGFRILYKRIVREKGQPHVVHAHFGDIGFACAKELSDTSEVPLVITEHNSDIMFPDMIPKDVFERMKFGYECAKEVLAVSPVLKEVLEQSFGVNAKYVPNIVDTALFRFSPRSRKKPFAFVSVGTLEERKGMDILLSAFSEAFRNSEASLTIVGDGPEMLNLKRMTKEQGLDEQVVFLGRQPRERIAKVFQECYCFVLASQNETFGVVYIEALASGLPVIATRCGGPETFVDESNGIMIDINDSVELAKALRHMYQFVGTYDCEKIALETAELFSPERVAEILLACYEGCVK